MGSGALLHASPPLRGGFSAKDPMGVGRGLAGCKPQDADQERDSDTCHQDQVSLQSPPRLQAPDTRKSIEARAGSFKSARRYRHTGMYFSSTWASGDSGPTRPVTTRLAALHDCLSRSAPVPRSALAGWPYLPAEELDRKAAAIRYEEIGPFRRQCVSDFELPPAHASVQRDVRWLNLHMEEPGR